MAWSAGIQLPNGLTRAGCCSCWMQTTGIPVSFALDDVGRWGFLYIYFSIVLWTLMLLNCPFNRGTHVKALSWSARDNIEKKIDVDRVVGMT